MIRVAHLFSGIEGFRYGLEKANKDTRLFRDETQGKCSLLDRRVGADPSISGGGASSRQFVSVYSNDIDKYACAISRYNYPDGTTDERDIRTINASELPDFDLLTFGWPCQDNSIAGKRQGNRGTRSSLLSEAVRILRAKKPDYFIAENVPGLFSVNEGSDFYEAVGMFTDSGYDCQWQVLNTRWFLPQNRERIIFVGHLRNRRRPEVFPIGEAGSTYSKINGEASDACLDANYNKGWLDHGQRTMICEYDGGQASRIYNPGGDSPTITTPSGGNHIPKIIQKTSGQSVTFKEGEIGTLQAGRMNIRDKVLNILIQRQPLKFLSRNQKNIEGDYAFTVDGSGTNGVSICTARTVRSSGQSSPYNSKQNWDTYLIDGQIRRLTPVECERLQGYPDNWTRCGIFKDGQIREISDTQRYKVCGNAVSTPVITAIGIKLLQEVSK